MGLPLSENCGQHEIRLEWKFRRLHKMQARHIVHQSSPKRIFTKICWHFHLRSPLLTWSGNTSFLSVADQAVAEM